jgi:hypothetical protein
MTIATAIVLWGLSLLLQGYLYSEPADQLLLRAAVGGLAIACFITFWVYVNTRADRKDKYGALHQFSPDALTEINSFEAELKYRAGDGTATKKTVEYKRPPGEKGHRYLDAENKPFRLNTTDYITSAIIVKEVSSAPIRFEAVMKDEWTYGGEKKTFRQVGGPQYIEGDEPGLIVAPSGGTQFVAIAINMATFVVLFLVFWPVLRFGMGHALGLSLLFGLVIILVLMPLLFDLNQRPALPPTPPATQKE